MNPYIDDIRAPLLRWAQEIGIAASARTATTFDAVDYAAYPAFIYPRADREELLLAAQWMVWFFLFDNHLDEQPVDALPPETHGLLRDIDQIISSRPTRSLDPRTSSSPYALALADLWERSRILYRNPGWERRYAACFADYQRCQMWELSSRAHHRFLDLQTYVENKRCSAASQLGNAFVELFVAHPVPDAALDGFLLRTLRHAAGDVIHLATDVRSSQRERRFDSIPNGVSTLRHVLDSSWDEAGALFVRLWDARAALVLQIAADLPTLMEAMGENMRHLDVVREYVDDLLLWMGGNMKWIAGTRRYDPTYDGDSPSFGATLS
ncbi:terpene synthase family protein [Sorangium sp. So ce1128]